MRIKTRWMGRILSGVFLLVSMAVMGGCSHESEPPNPPAPGVPPTAAQLNALQKTMAHNPPPGQANHISPQMQQQLQNYQALGQNGGAGQTH